MNSIQQRLTAALADRYRVTRERGAGGMATVYLAHDLKHERDVAIKVLHPDLGAALGAERFLAESKTTAKLQHPHIRPLLDSGAADGLLYYVMPYVRGETLRARLTMGARPTSRWCSTGGESSSARWAGSVGVWRRSPGASTLNRFPLRSARPSGRAVCFPPHLGTPAGGRIVMNEPPPRADRPHRDFLNIADFSPAETFALLTLAERMRTGGYHEKPLAGKALAMLFMKSSTRTRMSFEVGAIQLGGTAHFLSPRDVQIGRGEPIADTARVLSRYVHGIMIRTFAHQDVVELAEYASVPVINGLTDLSHPCQILADIMTVQQHLGDIRGKTVAWIGDGNNMANSWIEAAAHLGFALRVACPEGFDPEESFIASARARGADVRLLRDPREAARGADVITTDVWASMGQEEEQARRALAFALYQVDNDLMELASPSAIFLHCLPAHRGEEVTADVIDGPQSRVWDEAENRLHIQKAIMAALMGHVPL